MLRRGLEECFSAWIKALNKVNVLMRSFVLAEMFPTSSIDRALFNMMCCSQSGVSCCFITYFIFESSEIAAEFPFNLSVQKRFQDDIALLLGLHKLLFFRAFRLRGNVHPGRN